MQRFTKLDKKQSRNNKAKKINDNRCFQYVVTITVNHESIGVHPEKIAINWKDIKFSIGLSDWKNLETNEKSIHLKVLFVEGITGKIRQAYKSICDANRTNHLTLLISTNLQCYTKLHQKIRVIAIL